VLEQSNSLNDFGLVIAYVIPGFTFLLGCSNQTHMVHGLPLFVDSSSVSLPSLVLLIFLAVASGLIVQTIRWLLVDSIHHHTGIKPGSWDFKKLSGQMTAFEGLTENHYRFYQFYSGMVVSIIWILVSRIAVDGVIFDSTNFLLVGLTVLMFLGSRDTLHKYYQRLDSILTQA
jgi:hypothetical protein